MYIFCLRLLPSGAKKLHRTSFFFTILLFFVVHTLAASEVYNVTMKNGTVVTGNVSVRVKTILDSYFDFPYSDVAGITASNLLKGAHTITLQNQTHVTGEVSLQIITLKGDIVNYPYSRVKSIVLNPTLTKQDTVSIQTKISNKQNTIVFTDGTMVHGEAAVSITLPNGEEKSYSIRSIKNIKNNSNHPVEPYVLYFKNGAVLKGIIANVRVSNPVAKKITSYPFYQVRRINDYTIEPINATTRPRSNNNLLPENGSTDIGSNNGKTALPVASSKLVANETNTVDTSKMLKIADTTAMVDSTQNAVDSTSQKGITTLVEVGYGVGVSTPPYNLNVFQVAVVGSWHFTPKLSAGVGINLRSYNTQVGSIVAVFAAGQYNFIDPNLKRKISPLLGAGIGYSFDPAASQNIGFLIKTKIGTSYKLNDRLKLYAAFALDMQQMDFYTKIKDDYFVERIYVNDFGLNIGIIF